MDLFPCDAPHGASHLFQHCEGPAVGHSGYTPRAAPAMPLGEGGPVTAGTSQSQARRDGPAQKPDPWQEEALLGQDGDLADGGDMFVWSPESFSQTSGGWRSCLWL